MKFKINRKDLVSKLTTFVSKGKLNTNTPLAETIRSAYIYALENKINFIGKDVDTSSIYCRFEVEAEVEEQGDQFFPDLLVLFNTVKVMNGKDVTIELTKDHLTVSDGKEEMTFGVAKMLGFKDITDWNIMNTYDGKDVVFAYKNKGYTYTKWFTIEESSALQDIPDRVLDKTASSIVVFDTTGGDLTISAENLQITRSFKVNLAADVHKKEVIVTSNIFPVLKYLRGAATFYYYVQSDGKLLIYVINNEYEWMIRYKEVQKT